MLPAPALGHVKDLGQRVLGCVAGPVFFFLA